MGEIKVIDISAWQTNVPYSRLSGYGVEAAILRVTERGNQIDSMFDTHYKGMQSANIPVHGVYKFSYAMSMEEINVEANCVVDVLRNYPDFKGTVYLDLEYDLQANLGKNVLTSFVTEFKRVVTNAGYKFGIYANSNWLNNILDFDSLPCNAYWVASYPYYDNGVIVESLRPNFRDQVGWQFSAGFNINGEDYDMSVFDSDYINSTTTATTTKKKNVETKQVTADTILDIMRSWIGYNESDGSFMQIINIYNSYLPRARGYMGTANDEWCDMTVSAAFIKANAVDLIGGTECGVECHVEIFKKAGIWIEDGTITPEPGDIIVFNWDSNSQPNNGYSDHIGIVENVYNNKIRTIEGNSGEKVARREYSIGHGNIRGFARPKYSLSVAGEHTADKPEDVFLKLGSKGDDVAEMQKMLVFCSYNCGRTGIDGDFGKNTQSALIEFQKANGMKESGVYDTETQEKLKSAFKGKDVFPRYATVVKTPKGYLRDGISKYKNVIKKLPTGTKVKVMDYKVNKYGNLWYKVKVDNVKGWIVSVALG